MKFFRRRPSLATAGIAETVVLSQLRSIIQSAAKIAAYRNSKVGHFFNVSLHMNVPCVVLRKFNGTSTKIAAVDLQEKLGRLPPESPAFFPIATILNQYENSFYN